MSTTESVAPESLSLPHGLCQRAWERVVAERGLVEVTGEGGGPVQVLTSPMSPDPVGEVREGGVRQPHEAEARQRRREVGLHLDDVPGEADERDGTGTPEHQTTPTRCSTCARPCRGRTIAMTSTRTERARTSCSRSQRAVSRRRRASLACVTASAGCP